MSKQRFGFGIFLAAVVVAVGSFADWRSADAKKKGEKSAKSAYLKNAQLGDLKLKQVEQLSFGPGGLLLAAESRSASIVAIDTGDVGPFRRLERNVNYLRQRVAKAMGAKNKSMIRIKDMAVNPLSGKVYLAVNRLGKKKQNAILTISADGKIGQLNLALVPYARVKLPESSGRKVATITDVEFAKDRVLAAGHCREEFGNKLFSLPVPLVHGSSADIFSARTYHVAHGRWETSAPIRSFVPFSDGKKKFVVGAFACTPIAKFPLANVKSGAKIVGSSVVELGSGNMPLDMFTYEKKGQRWLVTNTYRFHYKKNVFGPSKWWGVRVNMDYMSASNTNEKAARRNVRKKSGPEGIEIMDSLFGAIQIAKLNNSEMVVLRVTDEDERNLEIAKLP